MAKANRFTMRGEKEFAARATAFGDNVRTTGARAVEDAAAWGAQTMERVIRTSGTGWEEKEGRVETGQMLRDVAYDKSAKREGNARIARFGWINRMEDYYRYQEEGFHNVYKTHNSADGGPAGETLPMHAFYDAYYEARERLRHNLNNITRKSWYMK